MKKFLFWILFLLSVSILLSSSAIAEDKATTEIVPKLTDAEMVDAPVLDADGVYPFYGTVCTNYTYKVTYRDEKGRSPAYVKINLNGAWHDMKKISGDYKTGALYTFNYAPSSGTQLFYYFEASNGAGKSRAGILDSPDQGPVFFSESLNNNQIFLVDKNGKSVWNYSTGNDWVEGVSIAKNGNTVAAVTEYYMYVFSTGSGQPIWKYCDMCDVPDVVNGNANGIDVSADGNYIAGTLGDTLYFFKRDSNVPLWTANIQVNSVGLAISDDANYIAVSVGDTIHLFDKSGKDLWKYTPSNPNYDTNGEMYRPAITPDASYIAVSTGCPDRKAYLFSRNGNPILKSEMLTTDSPVHKSAISSDGNLIAYSADNMQGKEIVFAYDKTGKQMWKYSNPLDSTARAVDVSADGNYVSAGTSKGQVYLFSKTGSLVWTFSDTGDFKQFGEVKFSPDGKYLAAGGTTEKIYMFSIGNNVPLWSHQASTWITKMDFNGNYVVGGTGAREYMFEGSSVSSDHVDCAEIKQFTPFWLTSNAGSGTNAESGMTEGSGVCGNNLCEPNKGENSSNCPADCMAGGSQEIVTQNNAAQPNATNTTEESAPELRKCDGIIDMIVNFFYSIVGKKICV